MNLKATMPMAVGILLDPPTKREAWLLAAVISMADGRARCHLTTASANKALAGLGLKPMDAAAITRARAELIRREWLLPSGVHTGLYFLNPRLFPSNNPDSTWHHKLCQEWDRGLEAYQLEHPKESWAPAFGDVEGL